MISLLGTQLLSFIQDSAVQQIPSEAQFPLPSGPQTGPGTLQRWGFKASSRQTRVSRVLKWHPPSGVQQMSGPKHLPLPSGPQGRHLRENEKLELKKLKSNFWKSYLSLRTRSSNWSFSSRRTIRDETSWCTRCHKNEWDKNQNTVYGIHSDWVCVNR